MPSGLSSNHDQLPKEIQKVQKDTRARRAEPLYSSAALGDSYKQLTRKDRHRTSDYGLSTEGKTDKEANMEFIGVMENLLEKPGIIHRENGIFNKQEQVVRPIESVDR